MARQKKKKRPKGEYIGRCECGGDVRGVRSFGRLWSWCERCTPVVTVRLSKMLTGERRGQ